jgi:cytochrome c
MKNIGICIFSASLVLLSLDRVCAADLALETYASLVSPSGEIHLPEKFRQNWTHLGSWLVNDPQAPGHGFHDVYTQAEAAQAFLSSGKFPDGAVLIKEIRKISAATLTTGPAQWAGDTAVWFVMVKDTQHRFPGNPHWGDGWGWALLEAREPQKNVSKGYVQSCLACHVPAKADDWVFLQGYPTLRKPGESR